MDSQEGNIRGSFLARLKRGEDLISQITAEFEKRTIKKGGFFVIGAVDSASLGYYDSAARKYITKEWSFFHEIVSCTGNVSLKDGKIFVHAHCILANTEFNCIAGHLMSGSRIFAAELTGFEVPGEEMIREFDEQTGLALWNTSHLSDKDI